MNHDFSHLLNEIRSLSCETLEERGLHFFHISWATQPLTNDERTELFKALAVRVKELYPIIDELAQEMVAAYSHDPQADMKGLSARLDKCPDFISIYLVEEARRLYDLKIEYAPNQSFVHYGIVIQDPVNNRIKQDKSAQFSIWVHRDCYHRIIRALEPVIEWFKKNPKNC